MIELYDHQKVALQYLRLHEGFALFHEQGTGKTIVGLTHKNKEGKPMTDKTDFCVILIIFMLGAFATGMIVGKIFREPPTQKIIIIEKRIDEPVSLNKSEWQTFTATAYCPCKKCCGEWATKRDGLVYTASSEIAKEGATIAADWAVLPPGTVVEIEGLGRRVVQDKGEAIKGNRIDIFFDSHQEALDFGIQDIKLKIIED